MNEKKITSWDVASRGILYTGCPYDLVADNVPAAQSSVKVCACSVHAPRVIKMKTPLHNRTRLDANALLVGCEGVAGQSGGTGGYAEHCVGV